MKLNLSKLGCMMIDYILINFNAKDIRYIKA